MAQEIQVGDRLTYSGTTFEVIAIRDPQDDVLPFGERRESEYAVLEAQDHPAGRFTLKRSLATLHAGDWYTA